MQHKTPDIINQPNMLGYQQLSRPVIVIIVVMTVERRHHCKSKLFKMLKRADVEAVE